MWSLTPLPDVSKSCMGLLLSDFYLTHDFLSQLNEQPLAYKELLVSLTGYQPTEL